MAIKVTISGHEIEAENEADVRTLLKVLHELKGSTPANGGSGTAMLTLEQRLDQFWQRINDRQRKFLIILSQAGGPLTDADIRTALEISTNAELAGTSSGITKNARRVGLNADHILRRNDKQSDDGKRIYMYDLTPDARALIERKGRK